MSITGHAWPLAGNDDPIAVTLRSLGITQDKVIAFGTQWGACFLAEHPAYRSSWFLFANATNCYEWILVSKNDGAQGIVREADALVEAVMRKGIMKAKEPSDLKPYLLSQVKAIREAAIRRAATLSRQNDARVLD